MEILISNSKGQPIYDQIYTQIKNSIISGVLKEGDLLPSIRTLAKDLRISVITTKRAYDELERDGFIVSVAGKGSYVAEKNLDFIKENTLREIENHMQQIYDLARSTNISDEELLEMYKIIETER